MVDAHEEEDGADEADDDEVSTTPPRTPRRRRTSYAAVPTNTTCCRLLALTKGPSSCCCPFSTLRPYYMSTPRREGRLEQASHTAALSSHYPHLKVLTYCSCLQAACGMRQLRTAESQGHLSRSDAPPPAIPAPKSPRALHRILLRPLPCGLDVAIAVGGRISALAASGGILSARIYAAGAAHRSVL